jgi:hypothetical protein
MTVNLTEGSVWQFIRQPGFILAILNFCIGLVWMAVILPLDAPDEPGHLQSIMQVPSQPHVHYEWLCSA